MAKSISVSGDQLARLSRLMGALGTGRVEVPAKTVQELRAKVEKAGFNEGHTTEEWLAFLDELGG